MSRKIFYKIAKLSLSRATKPFALFPQDCLAMGDWRRVKP